jgi:putative membrane protein
MILYRVLSGFFTFAAMKKHHAAAAFLIIIYSVGLLGTLYYDDAVMKLTPVNLLVSACVLFWFHRGFTPYFLAYVVCVLLCGFWLEYAGIRTGKIFGSYFYGFNLGYKVLDVPVIIGLNWLLLSYCTSSVSSRLLADYRHKKMFGIGVSVVAALMMVSVDYWIEQVAPRYDFWYWHFKYDGVPLQNYTAWFFFSFMFNFLFVKCKLDEYNPLAPVLLILQAVFFIVLTLMFS